MPRRTGSTVMSSPTVYERFELSPEEKDDLQTAQHFDGLAQSTGWTILKEYMNQLVGEAHEEMLGNVSNDPISYMRLQIRWQQRLAVVRAINQHVDSMVETKKELVARATEATDEYEFYNPND